MGGNGSTGSATSRTVSPYVGLSYYTEADAKWFFGRDEECQTIIGNLRAARLTLLYAQSGVGKSSLLRAGVARQIRELAQRQRAERGSPSYVPVVFGAWKDDPVEDLIGEIEGALEPFLPAGSDATLPRGRLGAAIEAATAAVDTKLLIILDQFEEYFLYRTGEPAERRFADELAACVNRAELRANFLIAIREDAYAGLGDLFAGKIANVYSNYLQLEYLDREAARETIVKPIEHFNQTRPQEEPIEIEPALIEAVLDQVRTGEVVLGQPEQATVESGNSTRRRREEIETPYLQLVMSTLWARDWESHVLRLATLQELGGAQEIVRTHLDGALGALPEAERDTALDIFHYLVTPSGAKIVYAASDLAEMVDRPGDQVAGLLATLAKEDKRIVRHVPPPAGKSHPDDRYEIFSDVLAPAIVDWRRRALEQRRRAEDARERERLEREKHEAEGRARRDRKRSRTLLALLGLIVGVGVVAFFLWRSAVADRNTAQSRQLAARAIDNLGRDPELSTLLALDALKRSHTSQAEEALRMAVPLLQLRRTLTPWASVTSATYSPDGSLIVTAESDGVARIWDASSHRKLGVLGQPGQALNSAAFSPDGKLVVTAGDDGTARLWNVSTHKQVGTQIHEPLYQRLLGGAFSPDSTRLVTASVDGRARIWDARRASHPELGVIEPPGEKALIHSAQFSPDGKQIVTAEGDGNARVWDALSAAQQAPHRLTQLYLLREPNGNAILSAAFSPDGRFIATTSIYGSARVWDAVATPQQPPPTLLPENADATNSAAFSRDSKLVVTASNDGSARIWDAHSHKLIRPLPAPAGDNALNTAVFAPDGRHVLTASRDGRARIWGMASSRDWRPEGVALNGNGIDALERASFSSDGKLIAAVARDGTASVWDASSGQRIAVVGQSNSSILSDVVFAPGNSHEVFTASSDGTVYLWNTADGTRAEVLTFYPQPVSAIAFAPQGDRLAVAAGDTAKIVQKGTWNPLGKDLKEPSGGAINDVAFSPDGRLVVTASSDGEARIWNANGGPAGGAIQKLGDREVESARFSPDGKFIVTSSDDGSARIWRVADRQEEGDPLIEPGRGVIRDAEFSADGSRILTVSDNGVARIWDASSQRLLMSLAGHGGGIMSGSFSPHRADNLVATSSSDGTLKLWSALPNEQKPPALAPPALACPVPPKGCPPAHVFTAVFSPNGRQIVTAATDGIARVWDASSHLKVAEWVQEGLFSAAFSPDGTRIVTAGEGHARIWTHWTPHGATQLGEPLGKEGGEAERMRSAAFSPDGTRIVTAGEKGHARVWQGSTQVGEISEPTGAPINKASFSPDGSRIVTASGDGTARIWRDWTPHAATQLAVVGEPGGDPLLNAAFSPNGRLIVTAAFDGTARVWNATTGVQERVLDMRAHGAVNSAKFNRDGSEVLTASEDGTAQIWAWESVRTLTEFPVGDAVNDASFAPNGKHVVTADESGVAQVWSTELAGPLDTIERIAKERVTRPLKASERATFGVG